MKRKQGSQSLYSEWSQYSNKADKHGLFDLKGLTCHVVEVELPAIMPMSEGIQMQTLALEIEVGI